jgi:hypothetical protein
MTNMLHQYWHHSRGRLGHIRGRRALVLVVVLVMVALLALLGASFTFFVHANLSTAIAEQERFQARMAAESGVQRAIVMLTRDPDDPSHTSDVGVWYDNPDEFRGAVVAGGEGEDPEAAGSATFRQRTDQETTYDPHAKPVWRFNVVARNYDDPETVRYGVTDECSKLDINLATAAQLQWLFEQVIPVDTENPVDIGVLVDSLLDWREPGAAPRANGAKDDYYLALDPPYACKKGPFSTVEELLLVRGFTAWVLYGEDYNRNGLLDFNENDGDETFPSDNADSELFAGVAPLLTVWSRELNTANDNRPRINLNLQDVDKLQEKLQPYVGGSVLNYILNVRAAGKKFNSVMNLLPAPPPPPPEEGAEEEPPTSAPTSPNEGPAGSPPEGENAAASQPVLSDLEQTAKPSEKKPATSQPVYQNLTDEEPPGGDQDLPLLLDRLTVQTAPAFSGRINISTAPRPVLITIEELSEADVEAIVVARRELAPEERATPAWLLTKGVLDEYKFRQILDKITTKSSVYTIETIGYADHVGVMERLSVALELRGPVAQVLYYRNLGGLGPAYRPHGDERRGITGMDSGGQGQGTARAKK